MKYKATIIIDYRYNSPLECCMCPYAVYRYDEPAVCGALPGAKDIARDGKRRKDCPFKKDITMKYSQELLNSIKESKMKRIDQERMSTLECKILKCEHEIECITSKHEPYEYEQYIDELFSELEGYREEYGRLQTAAEDELMEQSKHW